MSAEDHRFTRSLGRWEVAVAVCQARVERGPEATQTEFSTCTRMGSTISVGLRNPAGWSDESRARVEAYARDVEQQYPGLVLLPERV
jgi:hypothetical protein